MDTHGATYVSRRNHPIALKSVPIKLRTHFKAPILVHSIVFTATERYAH
jgi:hypothetical protein